MNKYIISWIAQVIIVIILGQTLFFKFTDSPETVDLFGKLGMGPFGYKLIGFLELVACVLLLIRSSAVWGAILGMGVMSGAVLAHLTKIGWAGANGTLGLMAVSAWLLCGLVIYLRRDQAAIIHNMFGGREDDRHS